ncbi:bifunctional phosphoribosylaminoimidazolecarboxamide formyltransferase/IMP cyclohydrolase [Pseudanabaena sp. FACHB-1998]|uniref:bifunctional phosphoribosylaminoimidazolecarboxamide formyltransferase/IMP cyclohydrolase n=1 Tax=Pseudanabaena sp. FACHB-1998 TaxID=2692858 RepID=UPI00168144A1|nr:bifunctional phosphoribosylaminoimidazolecarboxamide formyltransferase/IMP cyclohydrolase [Pseudanabaena sp. FACHB-1998]MBD2175656.1 bifunctional phosphoribosylaminoimidazolecarboxamide formyltransferase/IMP cyclohydrolase [Pseudanabaena sp. FACHB-1998]
MKPLALLSVSDKTGLLDLARELSTTYQYQLISSGGTAKALKAAELEVTKVSDYTGAPEILGGRVKTLHPRIHGGILARLDLPEHQQDLSDNEIQPIRIVVVNLYPFEETIAKPNVTLEDAIENIDIGGPTLIRASAKNYKHVAVLSSPSQYAEFLEELKANNGETTLEFRKKLAIAAFRHTQAYDTAIAKYLSGDLENSLPSNLETEILNTEEKLSNTISSSYTLLCNNPKPLRYGENPHQPATWYQVGAIPKGWSAAQQLQGKELSFNNLLDLEAARSIVAEFSDELACAVIIKHNNPCGVAIAPTIAEAYQKAFDADSTSAFGGIVALNRPIDEETAKLLNKTFLECVVAPACVPSVTEILAKKQNLRVLVLSDFKHGSQETVKTIAGGMLVQKSDDEPVQSDAWQVVTQKQPTPEQLQELLFAWKICRHVKSNAIAITKDLTTLGVGAGQMNRVGSIKIALEQAGEKVQGACLASDGFFPFDDSVRTAAAAGITAIVQPGGSMRDADSIKAADELGLVMVLTGVRHFLH